MKFEYKDGLLLVSLVITFQGQEKMIDRLAVDTGAVHTIISSDAVDDIGIKFVNGDQLVNMVGIGGMEYSFRKEVNSIQLGEMKFDRLKLDFGSLDGFDINGLIGLDLLVKGNFIINLKDFTMEIGPDNS